ncbi:MAG: cation:proton antiporter, partial [Candidatus Kapabacteria bacterium]|nr:cation:proton antiporter [Candidatus Kapabacteria bacterium]MDW7997594.1 cation:proton antiporter [Bacteroidota bacterium]
METRFLLELISLAGIAFVLTAFSDRLRIPPALSLLLCGGFIGPAGFRFITDPSAIRLVADIGVSLLLFTLGLEFSFKRLWQLRRIALLGGLLQMGLSAV